jgi:hypothetical protein
MASMASSDTTRKQNKPASTPIHGGFVEELSSGDDEIGGERLKARGRKGGRAQKGDASSSRAAGIKQNSGASLDREPETTASTRAKQDKNRDKGNASSHADRVNERVKGQKTSRTERMTSWRRIWTINHFLTPTLTGWIRFFFHSRILRWLGRQTPWMLVLLDVFFATLVGMTGSGWIKMVLPGIAEVEELEWYAGRDGEKLGGWGYCESG